MNEDNHFVKPDFMRKPITDMEQRASDFYQEMNRRRSIRQFSTEDVPESILRLAVQTAGTAPSGAHKQPWFFALVRDEEIKKQIRAAAEEEERQNYTERFTDEWKKDLEIFGTDFVKEHLTDAPWLIVVFRQNYRLLPDGTHGKNYYVNESVGIATGMLLTALHHAGLATLTHTPNPMQFLNDILNRPKNEAPVVIIPVGYPAEDAMVPDLHRKKFEEIAGIY